MRTLKLTESKAATSVGPIRPQYFPVRLVCMHDNPDRLGAPQPAGRPIVDRAISGVLQRFECSIIIVSLAIPASEGTPTLRTDTAPRRQAWTSGRVLDASRFDGGRRGPDRHPLSHPLSARTRRIGTDLTDGPLDNVARQDTGAGPADSAEADS
ncbi:MAG: hypothetical protein QOJ52_2421 [Acidimicrobiaceae bacterium]|nr:hypothetical protein [Acidimicrobiaceae bacterium]MDQ1420459.1 hypothetical protein [Acidimicrobiaceae bacterium]